MIDLGKRNRIEAAIARSSHDRVPRVTWTHLVSEHLSPAEAAASHLRFQERYDWDLLKVMHDVRLSLPTLGQNSDEKWEEWAWSLRVDDFPFSYQTELISLLISQHDLNLPIVETVFGPIQSLSRAVGGSVIQDLAIRNPTLLASIATALAGVIGSYIDRLAEMGCYGVFYTPGGISGDDPFWSDASNHQTWFEAHDHSLLARVGDVGMRRIIHFHGNRLIEERCMRFSAEIWNWAHYQTGPGVREWLESKDGAAIGGVRHTAIVNRSASEVASSINDFVAEAGASAIIGPGCAVPGSVSSSLFDTIRRSSPST